MKAVYYAHQDSFHTIFNDYLISKTLFLDSAYI